LISPGRKPEGVSGGIVSDVTEWCATDDLGVLLWERRRDGARRLWLYDSGAITISAENSGKQPTSKRRQRNVIYGRDDFTEPSDGEVSLSISDLEMGLPDGEFSASPPGEVVRLKLKG
jgi:hypothetical protein